MTNVSQHKGVRLAGGVLIGGLAAGMLTAMAIPTSMKRQAENWRDLIGVHDVSPETTPVLVYEAPPEDLSPVYWRTASQEYPAPAPQDQYLSLPDNFDADIADDTGPVLSEPLPAPLLSAHYRTDDAAPVDTGDAAGSSAQAAHDAAADVRKAEIAAVQPASDTAASDAATDASAPAVTGAIAVAAPS